MTKTEQITEHAPRIVRTVQVTGVGRVLILVYGVLALAAVGRSFVQIVTKFDQAPLAYVLSAIAALVYVVATVALIMPGVRWYRVALSTVGFELFGVLVIGTLSVFEPQLFAHDTVWSVYGRGYVFIPLVLPILGLWWLRTHPRWGTSGAQETIV
jgi:hypothetical protein